MRFPSDPKFPFGLILFFFFPPWKNKLLYIRFGNSLICCHSLETEDLIRRVGLSVKLEQQDDWWLSGFEAYPK